MPINNDHIVGPVVLKISKEKLKAEYPALTIAHKLFIALQLLKTKIKVNGKLKRLITIKDAISIIKGNP